MTRSLKATENQVQAVLYTFTFELPDPNQELFFQCPSTFPLFPKFPLEIRRLIWKETFHQTKHLWYWGFRSEKYCHHLRHVPHPPISAHINQESRTETLQHYLMLLPSATPCVSFGYKIPQQHEKAAANVLERRTRHSFSLYSVSFSFLPIRNKPKHT